MNNYYQNKARIQTTISYDFILLIGFIKEVKGREMKERDIDQLLSKNTHTGD